jgi:hypothetical protein
MFVLCRSLKVAELVLRRVTAFDPLGLRYLKGFGRSPDPHGASLVADRHLNKRLYFLLVRAEQLVIVGYVGDHLPTVSSRTSAPDIRDSAGDTRQGGPMQGYEPESEEPNAVEPSEDDGAGDDAADGA